MSNGLNEAMLLPLPPLSLQRLIVTDTGRGIAPHLRIDDAAFPKANWPQQQYIP